MNSLNNTINPLLIDYIETKILPQYNSFDEGHNALHIRNVIKESLALAKNLKLNNDMVFAIAVFHDLGIKFGRETHHLSSAKILKEDKNIQKWFNQEEILLMQQAIEDHRASSGFPPRNIYGKILADADREISIERVLLRTLQYGLKNYPNLSFEEHFERCYIHLQEKYGKNGYLKLYFHFGENAQNLLKLQLLIDNKEELKNEFKKYYTKECKG